MTSLRDNAVVSNIQLALLGIILVVGIFYNWRALSRLEDKMDGLARDLAAAAAGAGGGLRGAMDLYDGPISDEDAAAAEAFMQDVFGGAAASAAASVAAAGGGLPGAAVVVEEEPAVAVAPAPVAPPVAAPVAPPIAPPKPAAAAPPTAPMPAAAAPIAAAPPLAPERPFVGPDDDDVVAAALSEPSYCGDDGSSKDDGTKPTRARIRGMNAEALREACMSYGLPSDGRRALLVERLVDHLYG